MKMSNSNRFGNLLGVIHVGHLSCKFLVYAAKNAEILTCHEIKLVEVSKYPGWSEFDATVIWKSVLECIEISIKNLLILDINPSGIVAVGVCNQRETTVLWDSGTGLPLHNAIAWCDTRATTVLDGILQSSRGKMHLLREITGLPLSTCFSALKIRWLLENVPECRDALNRGVLLFGTLDSWILYNLTGGTDSGIHMTDVTNACRTLLMNLATQQWDQRLCDFFKIPKQILPTIRSCSEIYGYVNAGLLSEVPIASVMGDAPATLLGHLCVEPGTVTCNYDEGSALLFNTGEEMVESQHGLITTVAYKLGPNGKTIFALEGNSPNAGSLLSWLNNTLMIPVTKNNKFMHSLSDPALMSPNNNQSSDATDLAFVPAFNGFHTPFWRASARGMISGLTSQTSPEQIFYSAVSSIAFQTRQFVESLTLDCKYWPPIQKLIVGGEATDNSLLLQLISDICGLPIEKPQMRNSQCLGAMLAAGLTMQIVTLDNFKETCIPPVDIFLPSISGTQRDFRFGRWMNAVRKTLALDASPAASSSLASPSTDPANVFPWKDRTVEKPVSYSLPASLFVFSTFTLLLIAEHLLKK